MIEQIIQRNRLAIVANQWTFGQALMIAMLIIPVSDMISTAWRHFEDLYNHRMNGVPNEMEQASV